MFREGFYRKPFDPVRDQSTKEMTDLDGQYEISYEEFLEAVSIFDAIDKNNVEAVKEFIARDRSVLKTLEGGDTPLHRACLNANLDMVKVMLKNGADLFAPNAFGLLPIHYACIDSLLKDSDATLAILRHIVSLLKSNKKIKLLDQLLNTPVQMTGQTVLHYAVHCVNSPCFEMVQLLLDNGARPIPDKRNLFPSDKCADGEVKKLLKIYERGKDSMARRPQVGNLKNLLKTVSIKNKNSQSG